MKFKFERAWPRYISYLMFVLLLATTSASGDSVNTKKREVTKLAEGVYEIRHADAPDLFPQGNTTVIIGERGVFVVDSGYLPSSAREDIAQIRQWTDKPVRFLLITHFHIDHNAGSSAYAQAFPSLTIVAHNETKSWIEGANTRFVENYPQRSVRFKKMLESGKDQDGVPLTDIGKKDLETAIKGGELVAAEYKGLVVRLPDLTFDHELNFDLGNREVQVKFLGRGNTAGDAIAYLPKEKILITGDLLDYPLPYLGQGYPVQEIATLEKMALLDADTIVPGHGNVLHDKVYLNLVIVFMKTIVAEVRKDVIQIGGGSRKYPEIQAAVEKNIDLASWRQRFAGDDPDNKDFFDTFTLPGLVEAAHAELWPR